MAATPTQSAANASFGQAAIPVKAASFRIRKPVTPRSKKIDRAALS